MRGNLADLLAMANEVMAKAGPEYQQQEEGGEQTPTPMGGAAAGPSGSGGGASGSGAGPSGSGAEPGSTAERGRAAMRAEQAGETGGNRTAGTTMQRRRRARVRAAGRGSEGA
eukprot:2093253-Prymnesium_polylepis.1